MGSIKLTDIHKMGIPGRDRKEGKERYLKKNMAKFFTNRKKFMNL